MTYSEFSTDWQRSDFFTRFFVILEIGANPLQIWVLWWELSSNRSRSGPWLQDFVNLIRGRIWVPFKRIIKMSCNTPKTQFSLNSGGVVHMPSLKTLIQYPILMPFLLHFQYQKSLSLASSQVWGWTLPMLTLNVQFPRRKSLMPSLYQGTLRKHGSPACNQQIWNPREQR